MIKYVYREVGSFMKKQLIEYIESDKFETISFNEIKKTFRNI